MVGERSFTKPQPTLITSSHLVHAGSPIHNRKMSQKTRIRSSGDGSSQCCSAFYESSHRDISWIRDDSTISYHLRTGFVLTNLWFNLNCNSTVKSIFWNFHGWHSQNDVSYYISLPLTMSSIPVWTSLNSNMFEPLLVLLGCFLANHGVFVRII